MHEGKRTSGVTPGIFLCRKANTRLAECTGPQDEEVMIVAAKEKKHHCRSVTKLITNGAMQAQTDIMYVSENGIERGSDEESIHMAVARDSVLVTCPSCWFLGLLGVRFLRSLTTTVSLIRFGTRGCKKFDASRTVSLIAANLGSKDLQVRSLSDVLSLAAVAHFLAVGLESMRGMAGQWMCWTPRLWPESRRNRKNLQGGA